MTEEFWRQVFTIVFALLVFTFIVYIMWLILSFVKDCVEKAAKNKKIIDVKTGNTADGILNKHAMPNPRHIPDPPPIKDQAYSDMINSRKRYKRIYFISREDANRVLSELLDSLWENKSVSVADYYTLCGEDCLYADTKIGWYDLSGASIDRNSGGYTLDLPRPVVLN